MNRIDAVRRELAIALALAACWCAGGLTSAWAAEAAPRPPRAIGYAMWNDELLLLGAKVDDISLVGTSTAALSEAWRDDAVDFCLDMSGAGGNAIGPGCARVVISAAGGFTALVGTAAGAWRAQPDWLMGIKLGVEREGTLNRSDDTDIGYTVEVGIPWKFLGGPPKPGREVGFNFVVHVRGENETLVSWSSRVASPADIDRPDLWGRMVLSASSKPSVADNDVIICPFTYHPPLVDGKLTAGQWLTASVMQIEKPAPELVRQPPAGKPPGAPAAGGRLLATYRYDYQAAPQAESTGERPSATRVSLAHQPPDGVGPWFSADSIAWHSAMLRQAREAAIDTVLPVYSADPQARRAWSRLGLLRLAQALKETRDNRLSYPLVGMYLDTSCLASASAADLTTPAGQQALWGMVREFFDLVPQEFRAQFDIGAGDAANMLVLGPPPAGQKWDGGFVDYCRDMHRRAFGARLLILGDDGWRANAPNLDGYCSLRPGVGLSYGKDGRRPVVRLSPGYVGADRILAREGGQTYEQNWMSTIGVLPDFVIVDSLNDFAAGSEIADSRQYGVRFLDITRQSAQALAGRAQYRIAVLRSTLPPALNPGATYQVELLVENRGFEDLTEAQRVEISYTLRNKQHPDVSRSGIATRLFVRAGQRAPIVAEIATATADGPLPVGDYELSFEVTRNALPILRSRWLARRLFETSLPVRLDRARPWQATVLGTSLPSAMGAGSRRRVRVRLRNDGANVWRAKDCSLSYHWVRAPGAAAPEVVEFEGVRTPLPEDVKPGEMATMYAWVEARKADGAPLPAWSLDDDWLYRLQWDMVEGADRWFSRAGGDTASEAVAVLHSDLGFTVVNADLPAGLEAGKPYAVKVLVRNDGSSAWDPQRCRLACRWYDWDGAEASWQGSVTPLPAAVPAGEAALVTADIRAPDSAGSYRVAWALVDDDRYPWQELDAGSRGMLVQSVSVTGGIFEPLDVSPYVNILASTFAGYATRGAFDPFGSSLPAEFVPPDTGGPKVEDYPGVYYTAGDAGSSARVPLRYPAKDQRGAAAVACAGQRIALPQVPLRAIYLAASSLAATEAAFEIAYADGASEAVPLRVPGWMDAAFDVPAALAAPYVRTAAGDVPGVARIYLLRIGAPARPDPPAALILPAAPQIKIFAITVERQPLGGP